MNFLSSILKFRNGRVRRHRSSLEADSYKHPGDFLASDHHRKLLKRNTIAEFSLNRSSMQGNSNEGNFFLKEWIEAVIITYVFDLTFENWNGLYSILILHLNSTDFFINNTTYIAEFTEMKKKLQFFLKYVIQSHSNF